MAEPDDKPPEQKPTPNKEAFDELLWEIPFARTIVPFFIREGKAVKNGWVVIVVIIGITFWITHSWTGGNVQGKLSGATNYFSGQLTQKDAEIFNLKGQLADAKQDRDKYQVMLAPFEAMAIAKYTNAPMDQRLDLLANEMETISKELTNNKSILHLEINGTKPASRESPKPGEEMQPMPLLIKTNKQLALEIFNDSEVTAEHITVDFVADVDPSNVIASQWILEPKSSMGWSHWRLVGSDSYGANEFWYPQTIEISQNFKQNVLEAQFYIHADNSKTWAYPILLIFQK